MRDRCKVMPVHRRQQIFVFYLVSLSSSARAERSSIEEVHLP